MCVCVCNVLFFLSRAKFVIILHVALRSIIHAWPDSLKRKQSRSVQPVVNFGLMKFPVSLKELFSETESDVLFIDS